MGEFRTEFIDDALVPFPAKRNEHRYNVSVDEVCRRVARDALLQWVQLGHKIPRWMLAVANECAAAHCRRPVRGVRGMERLARDVERVVGWCLHDSNPVVRARAACALIKLGVDPHPE